MTVAPIAPKTPQPPDQRDYTNYGDCALNLPADWSRSRNVGGAGFILLTVGHERGVADAYRTMNPGQLHQFRWCAPEDQEGYSVLRTQHYVECARADWTKNEHLWMWNAEGFIVHNGQHLMAREKHFYDEDKLAAAREQTAREGKPVGDDEAREVARAQSLGAIIENENGRPMKPLRRG